jgi:hypothetical protein
MIRYQFKEEQGSLGKIMRPIADVVLEHGEIKVEIPMYIDSGADISMIPYRFGKALGFNKEEKDNIQDFRGQASSYFNRPECP